MNILVIGMNHKTAPVDLRERFMITKDRRDEFNRIFVPNGVLKERVVLSTCNRTELYLVADDTQHAYKKAVEGFSQYSSLPQDAFTHALYFKPQPESVLHLFSVASGIESMALGETEILGQVKHAYHEAYTEHNTGKVLNTLFQKSLNVGRKVRRETEIGSGKVSIASIAIDLSLKIFTSLKDKRIMLVGSGDTARRVCEAMVPKGSTQLFITNRNYSRASELSKHFGGAAIPYECLDDYMSQIDILITSTASERPIVGCQRARSWMKEKRGRSLFIIDVGVPRNVENQVGTLEDVYLYNIDDLRALADQNLSGRQQSVIMSRKIIAASAVSFMKRFERHFVL
jgi:glutamyl-tRNA reductase